MVIAYGHFMSKQRMKGKLWKCKIKRMFSAEAGKHASALKKKIVE